MKIAVVGAGLFGITTAYKLAKKHEVDVYEKETDILMAASSINQFRLHRGYHYPRSPETVDSSIESISSFEEEFQKAIIRNVSHYYCIAKYGSLTTSKNYLDFCERNGLEFKRTNLDLISKNKIDVCIKVEEHLIDPKKLKGILLKRLQSLNIKLFLGKSANPNILKSYDQVIICTYANINSLIKKTQRQKYQYEICEKIVVRLPKKFRNKSIVILDGPFMCLDPYGTSGYYLLGNVVHAIHFTNIGYLPSIPFRFKHLLNKGIITNPPFTNFKKFIESAEVFIPSISDAKRIGSMFTVRAVLPNKEKTDERPTIVKRLDEKTVSVFSGKLVNCVFAAQEVEKLIER